MRRVLATAAVVVAVAACQAPSGTPGTAPPLVPGVPSDVGPVAADAVVWALEQTIHVGDDVVRAGAPVRVMVRAGGRIYFVQGRSDVVRVSDGGAPVRTALRANELTASADGRYLGLLDASEGMPWSTLVVDLGSGEVVVRDPAGMGSADDDLSDLYEDAQPRVLGFDGDTLYVQTASGNEVMSWDVGTGERTEHGDQYFFPRRDPGGGRVLPALVREGRLVVPRDPYASSQWGHVSPDGAITLQPVGRRTTVFAVDSGRRLPVDLHGRRFVLGGWTSTDTAYGVAFDRSPYGPHEVSLVQCLLTLEQRRCRTLESLRPPRHELVLLPSGSVAADF